MGILRSAHSVSSVRVVIMYLLLEIWNKRTQMLMQQHFPCVWERDSAGTRYLDSAVVLGCAQCCGHLAQASCWEIQPEVSVEVALQRLHELHHLLNINTVFFHTRCSISLHLRMFPHTAPQLPGIFGIYSVGDLQWRLNWKGPNHFELLDTGLHVAVGP